MLKEIFEILSNPILYYVDKSGNSVFRNFSITGDTGLLYRTTIPKANAGKVLEYRFKLDRNLKLAYLLITLVLYFIFIHVKYSLIGLLFFELLWICLLNACRLYCANLYSSFLSGCIGKFEYTKFNPNIPQSKKDEFAAVYRSKIIVIGIVLVLFFLPALIMQYSMKLNVNAKKNFHQVVKLSDVYFALYPKSLKVYDMRAYAKAMERDYKGSLADYKTVLSLSGKHFGKQDYIRFANLLFMQKKVTTPTDAVDVFNEYVTKKDLSVLENSQMLWIKSIFKVENNIPEGILQEYDDLINSLDPKDTDNQFYLSSDKAYILYLMGEYASALEVYNILVSYAQGNEKQYGKQLPSLLAERGFTKRRMGDTAGAAMDFAMSQISPAELPKYEPSYTDQEFVVDKF